MIKTGIGKWRLMIFLILGIFFLQSDITSASEWIKTYGFTGTDRDELARSIQKTTDGGYIVAGDIRVAIFNFDFWVLKLDGSGNVQWQKTYGKTGINEFARSIQQTTDGGYIVTGETAEGSAPDIVILKLEADGNVQWWKTYEGASIESPARSIQETTDRGYIVAGSTRSFGAGADLAADFWVLKLDSSGNVHNSEKLTAIIEPSEGVYVASCPEVDLATGIVKKILKT